MSIFGTLANTGNTLAVFNKALDVVQNNVANVSTPGFARQTLPIYPRTLEAGVLPGGISAGRLLSTRDSYAETAVQRQTTALGGYEQTKTSLADLESVFDVSGRSGISASMAKLFQTFSAWSAAPSSTTARQDVLIAAGKFASDFRTTAARLSEAAVGAERQARSIVDQVNHLVGVIRDHNVNQRQLASPDPAREAHVYNTLEQLSEILPVTAVAEEDGTYTLMLGGAVTLLVGDQQRPISLQVYHDSPPAPAYPEALPAMHIMDSTGSDVSAEVNDCRLGALLEFRSSTIGGMAGTATELGSLNELALRLAETVNAISTSAGGPELFTYDNARPNATAKTLAVNDQISGADLVASDGVNANGVALRLAALATGENVSDRIDDLTYSDYFGRIIANLGAETANATQSVDVQASVLNQARNLRTELSGVSLNEEALHLIELQRAYEAVAQMTRVLDELTQTIIGVLR
jgi:flagellar hook-associated protein 1 FlgK